MLVALVLVLFLYSSMLTYMLFRGTMNVLQYVGRELAVGGSKTGCQTRWT